LKSLAEVALEMFNRMPKIVGSRDGGQAYF